jgi:cyclohexanone monooxygenase
MALNEQARQVVYMVTEAKKRGHETLEPTAPGEDAYVKEIRSLARLGVRFYTECTPGYYNSEGAAGNRAGFMTDMYGAGPIKFFQMLKAWREAGKLEGLALS